MKTTSRAAMGMALELGKVDSVLELVQALRRGPMATTGYGDRLEALENEVKGIAQQMWDESDAEFIRAVNANAPKVERMPASKGKN